MPLYDAASPTARAGFKFDQHHLLNVDSKLSRYDRNTELPNATVGVIGFTMNPYWNNGNPEMSLNAAWFIVLAQPEETRGVRG